MVKNGLVPSYYVYKQKHIRKSLLRNVPSCPHAESLMPHYFQQFEVHLCAPLTISAIWQVR